MKYYIDCGSHNGTTVKFFREVHDKDCEYHIYSFEPLPVFAECLNGVEKNTFYNKAVWIYDGEIDFYLSRIEIRDGSTVIKEKTTGRLDYKNPIKIKCIDFSKWIERTFSKDDYIVLKMNIEGAEYEILKKMVKDGTIDYIDKLFIDWHWDRIGLSKSEHTGLINQIKIPIKGLEEFKDE